MNQARGAGLLDPTQGSGNLADGHIAFARRGRQGPQRRHAGKQVQIVKRQVFHFAMVAAMALRVAQHPFASQAVSREVGAV
jgi:hypothetical protein